MLCQFKNCPPHAEDYKDQYRFQIDLQEYEKAAILGYDLSVGEYPDMAAIKYKVKLAESE